MMRASLLALACVALACSDQTRITANTDLELTSPVDGSIVFSRDPLHFAASASDNHGVKSLALSVGSRVARTCTGDVNSADPTLCSVDLAPADFAAQVGSDGRLNLSVKSVNGDDAESTRAAQVIVTNLLVRFVQPAPAKPAVVTGTSTLELEVKSEVPVSHVGVRYDDDLPLRDWDSEPYSDPVDWPTDVDPGTHHLTATALDTQGRTATATLDVRVDCAKDGECSGDEHCCSGTCAKTCN